MTAAARAPLRALLRLVLRIFFRRIEVTGAERVPADGPVIFVLNHPNGLIDPLFLLCLAPRRVSFLAKAPLFRMPLIGFFCRVLEAIPVYRRQDAGSDPSQNRETFEAAHRVLAGGGAMAIFPEGTSHSGPKLRPFKTGTARIAFGAAALLDPGTPIRIVPSGLYYRAKQSFRSVALVYFGEPFVVPSLPLAPGAEPPAEPVRELTTRIEEALATVTLQAEREEALALIERAQRIFSAADDAPDAPRPLTEEFAVRRRMLAGYEVVRSRWPERFARLSGEIERHEAALAAAGLDPHHLAPRSYTGARVARTVLASLVPFGLLLPLALVGGIVHYPAYRVVGFVATGIAKGQEEGLASVKVVAALLLFPLTWVAVGAALWFGVDPRLAVAVTPVLPLAGYCALVFFERLDRLVGRGRALGLLLVRRRAFLRLVAGRRAIREAILELGRELEAPAGRD